MKDSLIQWTDHTFNPWEGCAKVAPECKNCYAETLVNHRFGRVKWGTDQPRRRTSKAIWRQPLRWNQFRIYECPSCEHRHVVKIGDDTGGWECECSSGCSICRPRRPRVFCLSLGDWLDEAVNIGWLADLLEVIRITPDLDWQLLTKRPQNWESRLLSVEAALTHLGLGEDELFLWVYDWLKGRAPENVWIGVSAGADQKAALEIPAQIHFLSCEPMLHALDEEQNHVTQEFDWIIFGGESGKNARPCNIDWIRRGVEMCRFYGIAPFVKQLGRRPYFLSGDAEISMRTNRHRDCDDVITDGHGGDMTEWPEDLRIREFPQSQIANRKSQMEREAPPPR